MKKTLMGAFIIGATFTSLASAQLLGVGVGAGVAAGVGAGVQGLVGGSAQVLGGTAAQVGSGVSAGTRGTIALPPASGSVEAEIRGEGRAGVQGGGRHQVSRLPARSRADGHAEAGIEAVGSGDAALPAEAAYPAPPRQAPRASSRTRSAAQVETEARTGWDAPSNGHSARPTPQRVGGAAAAQASGEAGASIGLPRVDVDVRSQARVGAGASAR